MASTATVATNAPTTAAVSVTRRRTGPALGRIDKGVTGVVRRCCADAGALTAVVPLISTLSCGGVRRAVSWLGALVRRRGAARFVSPGPRPLARLARLLPPGKVCQTANRAGGDLERRPASRVGAGQYSVTRTRAAPPRRVRRRTVPAPRGRWSRSSRPRSPAAHRHRSRRTPCSVVRTRATGPGR